MEELPHQAASFAVPEHLIFLERLRPYLADANGISCHRIDGFPVSPTSLYFSVASCL